MEHWSTEHKIHYTTPGGVTPLEMSANMVGLNGILKASTQVLADHIGISISELEIDLHEIQIGSFEETFTYRFLFGEGKKGKQKFERFRKKFNVDKMSPTKIASLMIGGAVVVAAAKFVPSGADSSSGITITIENSFNGIARDLDLTSEEAVRLFETALEREDVERLKSSVVKFVHADGKREVGDLIINDEVRVPADVLSVIPSKYAKPGPPEDVKRYPNTSVTIRALDLDRPKTGWFGIAPEISDKRLKVSVSQEVQRISVPVAKRFDADIEVRYRMNAQKEMVPISFVILKMIEN